MSIEFTRDGLSQLAIDEQESPNSKHIAEKFARINNEIEEIFHEKPQYDPFLWEGSPGSPYVGPPNPEESEYLWIGIAHDIYKAYGKTSVGLQFEFGIDLGSNRGFFDRDVICGLYFGPWVREEVVTEVNENFQEHPSEIAEFLSSHSEYIIETKDDNWQQLKSDELVDRADELTDGFTITIDLSLADICSGDVRETVYKAFDDLLPLYLKLAGGERLYSKWNEQASESPSLLASAQVAEFDHSNSDSAVDGEMVELTVESIEDHSSILAEDDIINLIEILSERGASREEALQQIRRYAIDMERGEGLYAVTGLGPATGYALAQEGITTIELLASSSLDELKDVNGLGVGKAKTILSNVQDEDLARSGGETTKETSSLGSGAVRKSNPQEDPMNSISTKNIPESGKFSRDLPVVTHEGKDIVANPLSEYYEALRNMRKVVSTVMQHPGTDIGPNDLTDPCVQYYILLDACIGYGDPQLSFTGYGAQHQDRLSFRIQDYREAFGNGEWITDYQAIETVSYQGETQDWLSKYTRLENTARFVRPIPLGSEYPPPEIVNSTEELEYALQILGELPVYPPLPTEGGATERTIPINEIYIDLFSEVPDGSLVDLDALSGPGQATGDPITGPVAEATPSSKSEVESALVDYGKLTHLFRRITPPSRSPVDQSMPVFGLEWYRQSSVSFNDLQKLAKHGDDEPVPRFRRRLQDMIHRRFLRDRWDYDYITVFPGHEADSLSPQLVELAQDAVVETSIIYTPMLERTQTTGRQREKSSEERRRVAIEPAETLRARAKLDGETVILFDDICTTGSSLLAGAHLLQQAGAGRVIGLTLGFTPGGDQRTVKEIEKPDAYASEIVAGIEK